MTQKRPASYSIDNFPPDIIQGIGEIMARWGYLQLQLGVIVRVALALRKDAGRVVTVGAEVGALCGMIRTLTHSDHWIKDASIRRDLEALAEDVRKQSADRNDYAHGVFGQGAEPGTFVRHLMRKPQHRIAPEEEPITAESLKKISDEARELWIRAQDITQRLKGRK
jgi:hypothetical protein